MQTRCYFDMLDICVAYDMGSLTMNLSGEYQIVDSGLYDIPQGYNPLGKTARDLFDFSSLQPA